METKIKIKISSEDYARHVEDNVCAHLESALIGSFDWALEHLTTLGYDERDALCQKAHQHFQESGIEAEMRDRFIEIFERFGLNVEPDGRDY